jgi:periplasmic protein TonB
MNARAFDETDTRISGRRIAAISGAMVVHVIAAGFVLLPLTVATVLREAPPDVMTVIFPPEEIEPIPLPPIPEPPAIPVRQIVRPTPPAPVPVETPTPILTDVAMPVPVTTVALPVDVPDGTEVVAPVGGDVSLAMLHAPAPPYPISEIRSRKSGTVLLRILVDENGLPLQIEIAKSSGRPLLDRAALKQAYKWRFKPAMDRGMPVQAWGKVPVEFTLPNG